MRIMPIAMINAWDSFLFGRCLFGVSFSSGMSSY
jgi:hypothetical protein